jgi:hypothetical protein
VDDGERPLDLRAKARITAKAVFSDGTPAGDRELEARIFRTGQPPENLAFRTLADGAIDFETAAGLDVLLELRPKGAAAGSDLAAVVFQRDVLDSAETWDLGPATFEPQVLLAEGLVEDARGAPVAGASVQVLPLHLPTRELGARTDQSGRFVVRGPPAADEFDVFASTESEAGRLDAPARKGASGIRLVLSPAGRIRGRAASPTPALNALLRIELQTARNNVFTTARVLTDGSFELLHVPAGRWTLVLATPDATPERLEGLEVLSGAECADPRLASVPVNTSLVPASLRVMEASERSWSSRSPRPGRFGPRPTPRESQASWPPRMPRSRCRSKPRASRGTARRGTGSRRSC